MAGAGTDERGGGRSVAALAVAWWPGVFVVAVTFVAVGWPALHVAARVLRGVMESGEGVEWWASVPLFGRTLLWAGLIGVLATAAAWPVAWAGRSLPVRWFVLLLIPMLMPSYLASAGWGLLRAPTTPIGDWLLSGPSWRPILAGQVLAVGGLVLWSWPLAALVLSVRVRRIDPALLDLLRIDSGAWWWRAGVVLALSRGSIAAAAAAVMLLMLGSAVPLHLAQIQTHAIVLWRLLDESGPAAHWRVWASAWPMLAVAAVVAVLVGRALWSGARGDLGSEEERPTPAGGRPSGSILLAAAIWAASVVAPVALFLESLPDVGSLARFWRVAGEAVAFSAAVATGVGVLGLLIACAAWVAFARSRHSAVAPAASAGVLLAAGLMPGVLIGSGLSAAWNAWAPTRELAESGAVLVAGHTARFGFLAVLAGWWLARSEPPGLRDLVRLDGADLGRGWSAARLPLGVAPLVGVGLALAALSFHEIEAAVVLQPPGTDSFARVMLENLHFARMEALSAGAVYATGGGLGLAIGSAAALGWAHRMRRW